jgi:hypothetical protein
MEGSTEGRPQRPAVGLSARLAEIDALLAPLETPDAEVVQVVGERRHRSVNQISRIRTDLRCDNSPQRQNSEVSRMTVYLLPWCGCCAWRRTRSRLCATSGMCRARRLGGPQRRRARTRSEGRGALLLRCRELGTSRPSSPGGGGVLASRLVQFGSAEAGMVARLTVLGCGQTSGEGQIRRCTESVCPRPRPQFAVPQSIARLRQAGCRRCGSPSPRPAAGWQRPIPSTTAIPRTSRAGRHRPKPGRRVGVLGRRRRAFPRRTTSACRDRVSPIGARRPRGGAAASSNRRRLHRSGPARGLVVRREIARIGVRDARVGSRRSATR